jgi:hypothetical protein
VVRIRDGDVLLFVFPDWTGEINCTLGRRQRDARAGHDELQLFVDICNVTEKLQESDEI